MKLTKTKLKQIIKEEMQLALYEQLKLELQEQEVPKEIPKEVPDPKCTQHIEALKKDGFWPLKSAHFWNAKGTAVRILQRNKETGKAQWFITGTKASDTELLAAAMTCLKNKCARGSKVRIKGDRKIKMMQAKAVTKEDLKAYCSEIW
jgi:translation initiation factor 1 (eIF-1/SUI1)